MSMPKTVSLAPVEISYWVILTEVDTTGESWIKFNTQRCLK